MPFRVLTSISYSRAESPSVVVNMAGIIESSEEQISAVEDVVVDDSTNTELEKSERIVQLPLSRIKHMVKLDPDVTLVSQDAILLIARATVSFRS